MADVADAKLGRGARLAGPRGRLRGPGRRRRAGRDGRGHRAGRDGRDRRRARRSTGPPDMAAEVERIRSIAGAARAATLVALGGRRCARSCSGSRRAEVRVGGRVAGSIGPGLLVLLGVGHGDDEATADWLARRICELRIFEDDEGRTNRSLLDVDGEALVVVPVHALRGHAPRPPARVHGCRDAGARARSCGCASRRRWRSRGSGRSSASSARRWHVELVNDGPFTIWLDTADRGPAAGRGARRLRRKPSGTRHR